jgi:hypothetical protein
MQKRYFVLSCIVLHGLFTNAMEKGSTDQPTLRKSIDTVTRQNSQELRKSAAIAMYFDSPCGGGQSSSKTLYNNPECNLKTIDDRKPWVDYYP